jgi:hypothetical protein
MVILQEIFAIVLPLVKFLGKQPAALSGVRTLEWHECFGTDCGDRFLVLHCVVRRIGANLSHVEVLSGRVQQLRQLGEVARVPVVNLTMPAGAQPQSPKS